MKLYVQLPLTDQKALCTYSTLPCHLYLVVASITKNFSYLKPYK